MEQMQIRPLDKGMGEAVAKRTVFRKDKTTGQFVEKDMGAVAMRVAAGNVGLADLIPNYGTADKLIKLIEKELTTKAIADGRWISSGRHLQHGDTDQIHRNMELYTNCSTAIASFAKFYLLLNGSGVGRGYDDELALVDWANAPRLVVCLSRTHKDYPKTREQLFAFAVDFELLPWGTKLGDFDPEAEAKVRTWLEREIDHKLTVARVGPAGGTHSDGPLVMHRVDDSREGWAKAFELYEAMAFRGDNDKTLVLDFTDVRPCGAPIKGMQERPASGPLSVMRGFINIRNKVVPHAKLRDPNGPAWHPWEQAMHVDHYLSVEVQVGGARRAARMATKSWRDPGITRFIRIKSEGGLWTSNNSVMVDAEFWSLVDGGIKAGNANKKLSDDQRHALTVFRDVTEFSYINGEPGFINGDMLEDYKTGGARQKPVYENGEDFASQKYHATFADALLKALAEAARAARFPMIVNPCGEIPLHTTGGYCVIGDFAPLHAAVDSHGEIIDWAHDAAPADIDTVAWDSRVESTVRIGVRFLMRVNLMDALYKKEVERTNRIGISFTGFHEWAWARHGFGFRDLIDEKKAQKLWDQVGEWSQIAKQEAANYAAELGVEVPVTVTTIKPAGTTSKLYSLSEGAHLPARRQYIRWVQFKGVKNPDGTWRADADPLLATYEAKGYPVKQLQTFNGMSIVGFPTVPLIARMGLGDHLVTAPEATPAEQYQYLRLLEKYWIGESQGAQVSYTLKVYTDKVDLDEYRQIVLENQRSVRCCSVLPSKPDAEMGYEYLPEEEIDIDAFATIVAGINDDELQQDIDVAHLQCASGACPI